MNGKKARLLRRAAREYAVRPRQLLADPKDPRIAINDPLSERGIYRELKKEA